MRVEKKRASFQCLHEAKMVYSLITKLLRLALGLVVLASLGMFAPRVRASCGDYVQVGQSTHMNVGVSLAKLVPDSHLPPGGAQPNEHRPCSGPHCGRQPVQLPAPVAPPTIGGHYDQWAISSAKPIEHSPENQFVGSNADLRAVAAHPFRIERPPRCA
jgi:hypothetical protein